MYGFTVRIDIAAPAARVWSALCDPMQVVQWDTGVAAALDAPPDYPQPGQHVRWRYRNGPFRTLHDRPQEVVRERRLRAHLQVGPFRFDETYTLEPVAGAEAHAHATRLSASMRLWSPLGPVGRLVEQLYLGPRTKAAVTTSLEAIKVHCERPAA